MDIEMPHVGCGGRHADPAKAEDVKILMQTVLGQ